MNLSKSWRQAAGYRVQFHERLTESRGRPTGELAETALTVTVGALTTKLAETLTWWAKKRRKEEPRRVRVILYDHRGGVLREIQVDERDEG